MKKIAIFSKRTIIGLIISTLILFSLSWNTTIVKSSINDYQIKNPSILALTLHDPIEILSDANFTDYGFPGTGTETEPYIIEGYNITTTDGTGIFVTDTTKYFVIRNCHIAASHNGIIVYKVANGTVSIMDNNCSFHNNHGILLEESSGATLTNNNCSNSYYGINLYDSSNSTLTANTCNNNLEKGINLYESSGATLTDNTCNYNNDGIWLWYSSGVTLTGNTCNYNKRDTEMAVGIRLWWSSDCTLTNNTCANNNWGGILLDFSSGSTLANNTCTNSNEAGIYLEESSSSTLTNNTCYNSKRGIILSSSSSCLLTYNLLQENEEHGINIGSWSDSNTIHHNNFVDNNLGGSYVGSSQGCDDGEGNIWYDSNTNEGNWWSDWSGTGNYSIDGSAGSEDLYPLDGDVESTTTDETPLNFTLTLLTIVVPLLLTRKISRKRTRK